MSKKARTYINLVGSAFSPGRKRKKLVAKKGRRTNADTQSKGRGRSRSDR